MSEADGLFNYCNAAIIPALHIVERWYPDVEIKVEREREEQATIQQQHIQPEQVQARADFYFMVRLRGEDETGWARLFVLEAKSPGSLWPREWDPATDLHQGLGANATLMAKQGRKCLTGFGVVDILYADGARIAGIHLENEGALDVVWTGEAIRGAAVFLEERPEFFFTTF